MMSMLVPTTDDIVLDFPLKSYLKKALNHHVVWLFVTLQWCPQTHAVLFATYSDGP